VLPKVNDLVRADQKLKDLCMRRVSAKFVPQLMTAEQQEHHPSVASDSQKQTKIYKHCKWRWNMGVQLWPLN